MSFDTNAMLKPWVPSWYPTSIEGESGGEFICETGRKKWLDLIPDGVCEGTFESFRKDQGYVLLHSRYHGKFTYCPRDSPFSPSTEVGGLYRGLCISAGYRAGKCTDVPWWVGWNLVGHGVLILVKRMINTPLGTPDQTGKISTTTRDNHDFYVGSKFYLKCENHDDVLGDISTKEDGFDLPELPNYCWMFAFVDGWNGGNQTHTLTFRDNGIFFTIPGVNLRNCVFQEWTRPDLRQFNAKNCL